MACRAMMKKMEEELGRELTVAEKKALMERAGHTHSEIEQVEEAEVPAMVA